MTGWIIGLLVLLVGWLRIDLCTARRLLIVERQSKEWWKAQAERTPLSRILRFEVMAKTYTIECANAHKGIARLHRKNLRLAKEIDRLTEGQR